jgi:hypothetical protein
VRTYEQEKLEAREQLFGHILRYTAVDNVQGLIEAIKILDPIPQDEWPGYIICIPGASNS